MSSNRVIHFITSSIAALFSGVISIPIFLVKSMYDFRDDMKDLSSAVPEITSELVSYI